MREGNVFSRVCVSVSQSGTRPHPPRHYEAWTTHNQAVEICSSALMPVKELRRSHTFFLEAIYYVEMANEQQTT